MQALSAAPMHRLPLHPKARWALAALTLTAGALLAVGCGPGPEKVLLNTMYTADTAEITVVGDEETTRYNREGAKASDGNNSAIIRFHGDQKMTLFWLGGMGIEGKYEVTSATDDGLTVTVDIDDDRFSEGTATVTKDGSTFDLEFGAPVVVMDASASSSCTGAADEAKCLLDRGIVASETRKVQLHFVGERD